jgi:hypothetical protein
MKTEYIQKLALEDTHNREVVGGPPVAGRKSSGAFI